MQGARPCATVKPLLSAIYFYGSAGSLRLCFCSLDPNALYNQQMKNIVILISGGGSNMAAIVRASRQQNWPAHVPARVGGVISDTADAGGLAWGPGERRPA